MPIRRKTKHIGIYLSFDQNMLYLPAFSKLSLEQIVLTITSVSSLVISPSGMMFTGMPFTSNTSTSPGTEEIIHHTVIMPLPDGLEAYMFLSCPFVCPSVAFFPDAITNEPLDGLSLNCRIISTLK